MSGHRQQYDSGQRALRKRVGHCRVKISSTLGSFAAGPKDPLHLSFFGGVFNLLLLLFLTDISSFNYRNNVSSITAIQAVCSS